MRTRNHTAKTVMSRIADRVDLAIDAVTLGQYGLERIASAEDAACAAVPRPSRASRRRGDCDQQQYSWDWPRSACRTS